ncbi:YR811-like protein [Mya arenaria]|uniref:YR811-like protein n=1 Tax=Mya arenaria TaxID=6604 RepID=A0ABY7FSI3_MYAAR|nr:uncharacterized protein LOC128216742 [Mya arenaria]WAR25117.1 YR811-like protein [Mya arenaria]
MPATKRKASFRTPYERPSKMSKRSTSATLSGMSSATVTEVSASAPVISDVIPSPPSLRRASTLTLEEEEAADATKGAIGKRKSSVKKPASMSKKSSSFVDEGALVTRLSRTKSGSIIGETSVVATGRGAVTSIPSGLTKLALTTSGSKGSLAVSKSTLVGEVDETEMASALDSLRSTLSKEKSKSKSLTKKASSVRATLSKGVSAKSTAADAEVEGDAMDTEEPAATGGALPPGGLMELAISFDTTGSMYGCLEEVRAKIQDLIQRLQGDIPGIRIAIIAHGDYCDEHSSYLIKWIDFGSALPELCEFVKGVGRTGGGDGPECYELVLQRTREALTWTPGSQRALILIGDNLPHEPGYNYGGKTYHINWRHECNYLGKIGVKVYPVMACGFGSFGVRNTYEDMAKRTGGKLLELKNFSSMFDFIMMICYREANPDMMSIYEQEMRDREGRMADDLVGLSKTLKTGGSPSFKPSHMPVYPAPGGLFGGIATGKAKKAPKVKKTLQRGKKAKIVAAKTTDAGPRAKPKVTKKKPAKKTLKIDKVQKREKLPDSCMSKGPLRGLTWSKWIKVVIPEAPKEAKSMYTKRRSNKGYLLKTWFKEGFTVPAMYEFALQLPGKGTSKKYVVYCRMTRHGFSRSGTWYSNLLRHKTVRQEVNRVIDNGCTIYVRRGAAKGKTKGVQYKRMVAASDYVKDHFDYAWKKYIWRKTKAGEQKHRELVVKRKGVSFTLSGKDV